jgi:hypothetical protein
MNIQNRFRMSSFIAFGLTLLMGVSGANAQFTTVPTGSIANNNLRAYSAGGNYPVAPTTLTIGGVPFALSSLAGVNNSLGVAQVSGTTLQFTLTTSVPNPSKVYTLINSAWGQNGVLNGRIEFTGTGGAFASFDLRQGINIRDHWTAYNQAISDPTIVTTNFGGGARLDRQTFVLPAAFHTETLTMIRLVGINPGNPQGAAFIAAATVEEYVPTCDSIDFNNDGGSFDPQDIEAFLSVYGEGPCVPETAICSDIDFNNDGALFDPCDIDAFLLVFSEGPCTLCGV